MKKIVDLSGMIENELWGYYSLPGLENIIPPVKIETIATVKEQEFFASRIEMATISGTYLEAGSHMLEDGKFLDDYSVSDFIKPVNILRLQPQEPKALVNREMLVEKAPEITPGDALIIDTGWWRMWNKPGYVLDSPNFTTDALEWILEKKISILAVDATCIEAAWIDKEEEGAKPELGKGSLLGALFQAGALLAAPLVNLGAVKENRGILMCMPLKVKGTSGAPARIVFMFDTEG